MSFFFLAFVRRLPLLTLLSLCFLVSACMNSNGSGRGTGDDDDSGEGEGDSESSVVTLTQGSLSYSWDYAEDLTAATGWEDCSRTLILEPNTSVEIQPGCPECQVLMGADGSATTDCDPATGITDDPVTDMQYGITPAGTSYYWNFTTELWTELAEGDLGTSSYSGESISDDAEYDHVDNNTYTYDLVRNVVLEW